MTLQSVNDAISKLELLDPTYEFAYEEALTTFLSIKGIPVIIDDLAASTTVVRSRKHSSESLFYKISDLFIPPPEAIKSFARCNRPFQSKLYCSETRPVSYMELVEDWTLNIKPEEKVYVTITKWEILKPFKIIIVTTPDKSQRLSSFDKYYGEGLDNTIQEYNTETKEAAIVLYRFLFEKFRKYAKNDPKTYIITTAYCNLALHLAKEKADSIIYPSVPSKEIGLNFAFNKAVATPDFFKLISIIRNELTAKLSSDNKLDFIETGIIHSKSFNTTSNEIRW